MSGASTKDSEKILDSPILNKFLKIVSEQFMNGDLLLIQYFHVFNITSVTMHKDCRQLFTIGFLGIWEYFRVWNAALFWPGERSPHSSFLVIFLEDRHGRCRLYWYLASVFSFDDF